MSKLLTIVAIVYGISTIVTGAVWLMLSRSGRRRSAPGDPPAS